MVLKILALLAVLFLVYILFFKKTREKDIKKDEPEQIEDVMIECPTCGVYFSKKEGVLSSGRYYCSSECLPR